MKVRIKKSPFGSQQDYSLNNSSRTTSQQDNQGMTGTLRPVSREDATIEAEKGESIIGDYNNDGYMDHFSIGGNKHAQGGTPLNAPAGSFVFSNSKKMLIKDKSVLEQFGKTSKKGLTPAELAKQYDINSHVEVLKDQNADPIAKRTAQLSLDNNYKKLAQLADLQESMKGYPSGTPAIAASSEEMQEAAMGGLIKFQYAGEVKDDGTRNSMQGSTQVGDVDPVTLQPVSQNNQGVSSLPTIGQKIYRGENTVTVMNADIKDSLKRDDFIYLSDDTRLTKKQWNAINSPRGSYTRRDNSTVSNDFGAYNPTAARKNKYSLYDPSMVPIVIGDMPMIQAKDTIVYGGDNYIVIKPQNDYDTITVRNKKGEISYLDPKDVGKLREADSSSTFMIPYKHKVAVKEPVVKEQSRNNSQSTTQRTIRKVVPTTTDNAMDKAMNISID